MLFLFAVSDQARGRQGPRLIQKRQIKEPEKPKKNKSEV
jgi:hypothetical protein